MNLFGKLFKESIVSAFQEIYNNRLRAFLSLLGITIGIFCIISVFTAVDSLERNIRQSFQRLGENVIYVQKFPWNEDPRKSWWKYFRRPPLRYDEYQLVKEKLRTADGTALILFLNNKVVKHRSYAVEQVNVSAITHDYYKIRDLEFEHGRYFSASESQRGDNVVIIGASIAEQLFPHEQRVEGKTIKLLGREMVVIGVLKREGEDMVGFSSDESVMVAYNYVKSFMNVDGFMLEPFLAVKARPDVSLEEMMDDVRGWMRVARKLKPKEEDNFAMNQLSIITGALTQAFGVINLAGAAIGIFSILVGGFGIANIMFVSVKERTAIIGIKKALGAKRSFILIEFLTEAVVLCLLGGLIGIVLVLAESYVLEYVIRRFAEIDFDFRMSAANALIALALSVTIGLLAGFVPALSASMMRPVDAIRA